MDSLCSCRLTFSLLNAEDLTLISKPKSGGLDRERGHKGPRVTFALCSRFALALRMSDACYKHTSQEHASIPAVSTEFREAKGARTR